MRQYFLKKPVFLTFEKDGSTRVEAITGIFCPRMTDDEEQLDVPELRGFCDLVKLDGDDPIEFAIELERHNVPEGVQAAYFQAKWRADHWFLAVRNDIDAAMLDEHRTLDFSRFDDLEWREKLLDAIEEAQP